MNALTKSICGLFAAAMVLALAAQPAEAAGLSVDLKITKSNAGNDKLKLKLKVTAKVDDGPMATLEVANITVAKPKDPSKGQRTNLPPFTQGPFSVTGYVEWKNNTIKWVSTVEVTVGLQKYKVTRTETITASSTSAN